MTSSPDNNQNAQLAAAVAGLQAAVEALRLSGQELAARLRDKQAVLVANRLAELEAAAEAEAGAAAAFHRLERERQAAQEQLSGLLLLSPETSTLQSTLAALQEFEPAVPAGTLETLQAECESLTDQLAELAQLNSDNAYLSANMLDYTRMLLGALSGSGLQSAYGSNGRVTQNQPQELVSIKA